MSIKLPTDRSAPLPPPLPPEGPGKKKVSGQSEGETPKTVRKEPPPGSSKEAVEFLEQQSLATKLQILARQVPHEDMPFPQFLKWAMDVTRAQNPQAAVEEVNRRLQKEIEDLVEQIKENKEWAEETAAWARLGDLLERELTPEQREQLENMLQEHLRSLVS